MSHRHPRSAMRRSTRRLAFVALVGLLLGGVAGLATSIATAQDRQVPTISEQRPELATAMYAGRTSVAFTVYDCATSQPLAAEAANASSTWNIDAPVQLIVQSSDPKCKGAPSNDRSEIYFVQRRFHGPEVGDYQPHIIAGQLVAEDLRVSMPGAIERARELSTSVNIVIFNQLMNAFGHVLGLGDAHRSYPDSCHWSVMLGNCRLQRTMPSRSDRDALARIYGADLELHRELRSFDTNDNGRIDDAEFRAGLRQWIQGRVTDEVFLELLEVWSQSRRLSGSRSTEPASNHSTSVRLYDLSGRLVAEQGCRLHTTLTRIVRSMAGPTLPRGVYIARVRDCQTGAVRFEMVGRR